MAPIFRILREIVRAVPSRLRLIAVILALSSAFSSLFSLLPVYFGSKLVSDLSTGRVRETILDLGLLGGTTAVFAVLGGCLSWMQTFFTEKFSADIRRRMFDALLAADPLRLTVDLGQAAVRADTDVDTISGALQSTLFPILYIALSMASSLIGLTFIDVRLSAISLLAVPVAYLLAHIAAPRIAEYSRRTANARDRIGQKLLFLLSDRALVAIRSFLLEDSWRAHFASLLSERVSIATEAAAFGARIGIGQELLTLIPSGLLTVVAVYLIHAHTLTLTAVLVGFALYGRLFGSVSAIAGMQIHLATVAVSWARVQDVFNLERAHTGTHTPIESAPALAAESIAVARGRTTVFSEVSFAIQYGETVGIIGPNGAGKTTLALALAGFVRPTSGHIRLGGLALEHIDASALHREVLYVGAEPLLLPGTLADNVLLQKNDRAIAIIRDLGVNEIAAQLPESWATEIGTTGTGLSRGEEQRITLARAIMWNPRVLILDESTSGIDRFGEEHVLRAVRRNFEGILIVISHDDQAAGLCDRFFHLSDAVLREGVPLH